MPCQQQLLSRLSIIPIYNQECKRSITSTSARPRGLGRRTLIRARILVALTVISANLWSVQASADALCNHDLYAKYECFEDGVCGSGVLSLYQQHYWCSDGTEAGPQEWVYCVTSCWEDAKCSKQGSPERCDGADNNYDG